eukprot:155697-Amphidinium_carterae.1
MLPETSTEDTCLQDWMIRSTPAERVYWATEWAESRLVASLPHFTQRSAQALRVSQERQHRHPKGRVDPRRMVCHETETVHHITAECTRHCYACHRTYLGCEERRLRSILNVHGLGYCRATAMTMPTS